MTVMSPSYGTFTEPLMLPLKYTDSAVDLVRAVVNHFNVTQGFKVFVKSDVPPGSGLGGSSTLMVAIIKAFAEWKKVKLNKYQLADLAFHLEREEIGLGGGKQDQYAAAFGGFNMMYFNADGTEVKPVKIKDSVIKDLEQRSILCFTGKSRDSAAIIKEQVRDLKKDTSKEDVYESTKRLALFIGRSMKLTDIDGAAALLNLAWEQKKKFSSKISNGLIDSYYSAAMENGALGGKVSGAGGGGFMFFVCAPGQRDRVAKVLRDMGAEIMDFSFDPKGARTWKLSPGEHYERSIIIPPVSSKSS